MPKVFISYSHFDKPFTEQLVRALRRMDVDGFYDQHDLTAGASLRSAILEALRRTDAVVVVLSHQARSSATIGFEIGAAESLGKKIIPVLIPGESWNSVARHELEGLSYIESGNDISETAARIAAISQGIPLQDARAFVRRRPWLRNSALLLVVVACTLVAGWLIKNVLQLRTLQPELTYTDEVKHASSPPNASYFTINIRARNAAENIRFCVSAPRDIIELSEPHFLNTPDAISVMGVKKTRITQAQDCFGVQKMRPGQSLTLTYEAVGAPQNASRPNLEIKADSSNFRLVPVRSKPE